MFKYDAKLHNSEHKKSRYLLKVRLKLYFNTAFRVLSFYQFHLNGI